MKSIIVNYGLGLLLLLVAVRTYAVPINSNSAFNPYAGGLVVRTQVIHNRARKDNVVVTRETVPTLFAYGVSSRFSLIGMAPYIFTRKTTTPNIGETDLFKSKNKQGFGDGLFLMKYIYFKKDFSGSTLRVAVPAGIVIPSHEPGLGKDSLGGILGQVLSWQTLDFELDLDISFRSFDTHKSVKPGNIFQYNAAFGYRLLPWELPDEGTPTYLNLVLELNGETIDQTRIDSKGVADTGGNILFFASGLQIAGKDFVVEMSWQKPIYQHWNDSDQNKGRQFTIEERLRIGLRVII